MPFTLITGTYHLVGASPRGRPTGFRPDGDSMQFRPQNPALLDGLQRIDRPYRLTAIGSTQLRFEGIDALELHFQGTHQPRPLADEARELLTGALGMNPVPYRPPERLTVQPPVPRDAVPGFILSRALEVNGRPVAFAYAGPAPAEDGAAIRLEAPLLRRSLNHRILAAGQAYPLFYDTLFADLRRVLAAAANRARREARGLWARDRTETGLAFPSQAALERNAVVFPKLFRRLVAYLDTANPTPSGFLPWLADTREQVLDLTTDNFVHFEDVLSVRRGRVRMERRPDTLVFVSAKTRRPTMAPWMRV